MNGKGQVTTGTITLIILAIVMIPIVVSIAVGTADNEVVLATNTFTEPITLSNATPTVLSNQNIVQIYNFTTATGGSHGWNITTDPFEGIYSMGALQSISEVEVPIDTTGLVNITYEFYAKTIAFGSNNTLNASYYNGSGYESILDNTGLITPYTRFNGTLGPSANNNANFKLKFRCQAQNLASACEIDNVAIGGVLQ